MKGSVMFFLSFLLFVFISISVSGNNAFAKSGTVNIPVEAANFICPLSTAPPPIFTVVAFCSADVSVTPTPAADDEWTADLGMLFAATSYETFTPLPLI